MPLPRSTFVMGAAVAGVLALAIRGTVTHEHVATLEEQDEAAARAQAQAEAERSRELDEARSAKIELDLERAKLVGWTKKLVGAEVATFGGPFAGVALPVAREQVYAAATTTTNQGLARVDLLSLGDYATVDQIAIAPLAKQDAQARTLACNALERELTGAWGEGKPVADDLQVWVNAPRRMRATFKPGDACKLAFEHVLAVDAWLDAVALVGKRHDQLPASTMWGDRGTATLTEPGAGIGEGPTMIEIKLRAGKVIGLRASVATDAATQAEIETKRWKGAKIERSGAFVALTAGEAP